MGVVFTNSYKNNNLQLANFWMSCVFRGLIVPSKEKKKVRKSTLMRKLRHSKNEDVTSTTPRATGLVGLLETMRAQLEECFVPLFLSLAHQYLAKFSMLVI